MADVPPIFTPKRPLKKVYNLLEYVTTNKAVSAPALKQGWVSYLAWAIIGKLAKTACKGEHLSTY